MSYFETLIFSLRSRFNWCGVGCGVLTIHVDGDRDLERWLQQRVGRLAHVDSQQVSAGEALDTQNIPGAASLAGHQVRVIQQQAVPPPGHARQWTTFTQQ